MPKKFRRGRHYKNEERKKRAARLAAAQSACDSISLVVSLPLQAFTEAPVSSLEMLVRRLKAISGLPRGKYNIDNFMCFCIQVSINLHNYMCYVCDIQYDSPMYAGWTVTSKEERLVVSKLDISRTAPELRYSICIFHDMTWKAYVYGMQIATNQLIAGVPLLLSTTAALCNLLTSLDTSHICEGNRDGKFEKLLTYRGFTGSRSEYQLYCLYEGRRDGKGIGGNVRGGGERERKETEVDIN